MTRPTRPSARSLSVALAATIFLGTTAAVVQTAQANAPIRVSTSNRVPACVTPERLMAFLKTKNDALDPRFRDIAKHYKAHGERLGVRWDYAFFQMAIETNFLTYLRPNGKRGDVDPRQNNFAGIGTTGGGVPGDSYPDVSTGVLAQIQHLVVYSGERIAEPVAPRTRLKQDHILILSEPIAAKRAVTFQDLSGRWAVDRAYGRSIGWVAERFREQFCTGPEPAREEVAKVPAPVAVARASTIALPSTKAGGVPPGWQVSPRGEAKGEVKAEGRAGAPAVAQPLPQSISRSSRPLTAPSHLGAAIAAPAAAQETVSAPAATRAPETCRVQTASYGGRKVALIEETEGETRRITALGVHDGFERSMTESFIRTRAPGGQVVGTFEDREAALRKAYEMCPAAKPGQG